ncbi:MAG: M23 family metallopeptidase, partial [Deltaproteobacteria bacterium]
QRDERFGTVTVHHGLDLKAPAGSPVRAVYSGKVVFADWFEGYGLMVVIDHGGGYFSLYAHLDRLEVSKGQKVRKGQLLGGVGETGSLKGPYLYFEIRNRGKPVDPAKWIRP